MAMYTKEELVSAITHLIKHEAIRRSADNSASIANALVEIMWEVMFSINREIWTNQYKIPTKLQQQEALETQTKYLELLETKMAEYLGLQPTDEEAVNGKESSSSTN